MLQAQQELLNWNNMQISVMEISHRSPEYIEMAAQAEQDLRDLMAIPDNYHVLFLQGGATMQFAAVPLNLMGKCAKADYLNTGHWSEKAVAEGGKYGQVTDINALYSVDGKVDIRPLELLQPQGQRLGEGCAYVHYTPNETIEGIEYSFIPEAQAPLVADMSSTILSRPIDVSQFGIIYAGAQKNIGPSGLTVVIVRDDLVNQVQPSAPSLLQYRAQIERDSMLNTPPTFGWYLAGLVFKWLKKQGGVEAFATLNQKKADVLYQCIDASDFYHNPVATSARSWMNIPFTLANPELDKRFLEKSREAGLLALKGHRAVGGMRASIYNAMPYEGVVALVEFMKEFEKNYG
jgi:phosphoserine aminotransferase